jgi:hypothetical protein
VAESGKLGSATLLFLLLFASYAYFYQSAKHNEAARFDQVRALVERGTFAIDAFAHNSADVVEVVRDGRPHVYPNKAPGLTGLALLPFAFWSGLLSPLEAASHVHWHAVAYLTTVTTVGLLSALAGVAMFGVLRRLTEDPLLSALSVAAVWLGSIAFPFSTLFFSHQAAAALLALAFCRIFALRQDGLPETSRASAVAGGAAGALIGLSVATEYPTAILAGLLALYGALALRQAPGTAGSRRWWAGAFVAGLVLGVGVLVLYNLLAFGQALYTPYQEYASQGPADFRPLGRGIAGVAWPGLRRFLNVLAEITVRPQRGLLYLGVWQGGPYACSPVLWLALPGLYFLARRPGLRAEAALCAAGLAAYLTFNACYGDSIVFWGGATSVGPRHLVPVLPLAALPLCLAARRLKLLFLPLLLLSVFSMLIATAVEPRTPYEPRNPWRDLYVPSYLQGAFAVARDGLFDPDRMLTADSTAFNLAKLAGIPARWQLAPLALGWLVLGGLLLRSAAPPSRGRRAALALLAAYTAAIATAPALLGPPALRPSTQNGLTARLYDNATWTGEPVEVRLDRALVFDWREDPPLPAPFSAEWSGFVLAREAGRYTFALESDDGSVLSIDGITVVNNGGVHAEQRRSGAIRLTAGAHPIRLRYFNLGFGAILRVLWSAPGLPEVALPPEVLLPESPTSPPPRPAT